MTTKKTNDELRAILEASQVTTETVVPEEENVLMIDNVGLFSRDDIHAIKAGQKQGKTTALKVILATLITGVLFRLKSLVLNPDIVYFDTEQSRKDVKQILNDVQQLTGADTDFLNSHVSLYSLRSNTPDELRHLLELALDDKHPDVVIVDGLVELVKSFNEEEESKAVVQSLLILAEKYHCAIIVVLHTNKSELDHNMRGHLGSMLAQKAATVLECAKNGSVITVRCTDTRHQEIPSWSIMYDENGHILDAQTWEEELMEQAKTDKEKRRQVEADKKRQKRMDSCCRILNEYGGSLPRKELVNKMMEALKEGHSVLHNFVKEQINSNQLQIIDGKVHISQACSDNPFEQ